MLIDYIVLLALITAPALIWRMLLLDHPTFLSFVEKIPFAGGALTCGFCTAMWFSLVGVLITNPLQSMFVHLHWTLNILLSWFVVSVGVLLLRNTITTLMEATGVLTGIHHGMHDHEK